ncbi:hypothetical protein GGS24DRAFT_466923 [Hypoxylon argillaceum]|nr:hypothetical protein GGS24DRAFT_466923 [Hypoxylon argillaceum]
MPCFLISVLFLSSHVKAKLQTRNLFWLLANDMLGYNYYTCAKCHEIPSLAIFISVCVALFITAAALSHHLKELLLSC